MIIICCYYRFTYYRSQCHLRSHSEVSWFPTSSCVIPAGQFWNIPITTHVFDAVNNSYIVTVEPPGRPARHFISDRYNRVWDNSRRVCYYTGNGQGGRSGETLAADDSVIEGNYRDYLVADLFSDEFLYEEFENERCTS